MQRIQEKKMNKLTFCYNKFQNSQVQAYLLLFYEKSGIHGVFYFAQVLLTWFEK